MQTVKFLVEKTGTGYTAYAEDFSILATGKNLKQVYADAEAGLAEQCEYMNENPADYQLEFTYDFPTLFEVYRLNVEAISAIVGINATLVSQYINGKKTPSRKQKDRIEEGIHSYARGLDNFRFA
jgi:hypothetical protein